MAAKTNRVMNKFGHIFSFISPTILFFSVFTIRGPCPGGVAALDVQKVEKICSLASCSSSHLVNSSMVLEYCKQFNMTVHDRCCVHTVNATLQYTGLDLSGCDMGDTKSFQHLHHLKWIVLDDNPLENGTEFEGLPNIDYLSLPAGYSCPGGEEYWESVQQTNTSTLCLHELNTCTVSNVSCPNVSVCVSDGPGYSLCLCDGDRHGYKCMRTAYFPYIAYILTLCGVTFVVSVFLWSTQRIRVKHKKER